MYRLPPSVFACRLMGALAADPIPSRIMIHRTSLVGSLPGTIGAATAACGGLHSVGGIITSSYMTVLVRTVYRTISLSACRTSEAGSRRWLLAAVRGETEIWRSRWTHLFRNVETPLHRFALLVPQTTTSQPSTYDDRPPPPRRLETFQEYNTFAPYSAY